MAAGAEVAHALWQYVLAGVSTAAEADAQLETACALTDGEVELSSTPPAGSLLAEALREAVRLNHPVYDLIYLVSARRLTATLATCDHKLASLAKAEGIDVITD
jgi:predicted nucleic acid-binding protein